MTADANAISFTGPTSDMRFPWSSIGEVDETAHHVILWVHAYQGIPIPVAAFCSPADASRFSAFAKAYATGPKTR